MPKSETNVRSIERALTILDCFTRDQPSLSLVEIAKMIDLYPSTTSRLLSTLENLGYIKRNEKSLEYSLGYKLANLGAICLSTEDLRSIARPFLVKLRNRYNESVGLYVVNKNQRVCIDCVPSTQPLHRVIDVGTRMSMTRGAAGKLLLSYMPEETVQSFLNGDPYVTIDQLEEIRQKGYAVSFNEQEQNLVSIAAPIFDAEHQIKAALFISGPTFRIASDRIEEIAQRMIETAHEISVMIGY